MLSSAKLEDPGNQSEEQETAGTTPDVERWLSCYACRMLPRPPAGPTEECARCGGHFCPRCLIGQLCFMCHFSEKRKRSSQRRLSEKSTRAEVMPRVESRALGLRGSTRIKCSGWRRQHCDHDLFRDAEAPECSWKWQAEQDCEGQGQAPGKAETGRSCGDEGGPRMANWSSPTGSWPGFLRQRLSVRCRYGGIQTGMSRHRAPAVRSSRHSVP